MAAGFVYGVFGRRETTTINGATATYVWDGEEAIAEDPTSGSPTYTVNSPFIDEPISRGDRFFTPNHLGSTTTLTSDSGVVVERYSYLPFGETWPSVGGPLTANPANPFQFTGRENDGTGLMYYRARYYAPEWGRFVSEDPIGLAGVLNQYSYALNNPVLHRDPTGEVPPLLLAWGIAFLILSSERAANIPKRGYQHRPVIRQISEGILRAGELGRGGLLPPPDFASSTPQLGPPLIHEGRGVRVVHRYHDYHPGTPMEHGPAHATVEGGGPTTRIGPKGIPLKGSPALTPVQRKAVEEGRNIIRHRLNRIGRYLKYVDALKKAAELAPK